LSARDDWAAVFIAGIFHSRPSAAGAAGYDARVAAERKISEAEVARLVQENSKNRQWGFLGEPRVNVLQLNLALDAR
jgi:K+-transporting ATPase ATPase C chain